jgi:hypothetical protein
MTIRSRPTFLALRPSRSNKNPAKRAIARAIVPGRFILTYSGDLVFGPFRWAGVTEPFCILYPRLRVLSFPCGIAAR